MKQYILMWRVGNDMYKEIVQAPDADEAVMSWECWVDDKPDTQLLLCDLA